LFVTVAKNVISGPVESQLWAGKTFAQNAVKEEEALKNFGLETNKRRAEPLYL